MNYDVKDFQLCNTTPKNKLLLTSIVPKAVLNNKFLQYVFEYCG